MRSADKSGRYVFGSWLRSVCAGLGGLSAQDVPTDIRAKFFAAHQAAGGSFDCRATLGGDLASTRTPKTHSLSGYTDCTRKPTGIPHVIDRGLNWFHAVNSTHVDF